jgi:hypothetical protein
VTIHSSDQSPRARKDRLIVKDLPDETLVYDLENDKAHCLNNTSALVWRHCDGQSSVSEIAQSLTAHTKTKVDDAVVWLALDQLQKFDLLEEVPAKPAHLAGMNRRQLVRNVGLAALALPVIMSIAAPAPAQTASQCACTTPNCRPIGCPCGNPSDCVNPGGNCDPVTKICV